jgi:hypothetical protein
LVSDFETLEVIEEKAKFIRKFNMEYVAPATNGKVKEFLNFLRIGDSKSDLIDAAYKASEQLLDELRADEQILSKALQNIDLQTIRAAQRGPERKEAKVRARETRVHELIAGKKNPSSSLIKKRFEARDGIVEVMLCVNPGLLEFLREEFKANRWTEEATAVLAIRSRMYVNGWYGKKINFDSPLPHQPAASRIRIARDYERSFAAALGKIIWKKLQPDMQLKLVNKDDLGDNISDMCQIVSANLRFYTIPLLIALKFPKGQHRFLEMIEYAFSLASEEKQMVEDAWTYETLRSMDPSDLTEVEKNQLAEIEKSYFQQWDKKADYDIKRTVFRLYAWHRGFSFSARNLYESLIRKQFTDAHLYVYELVRDLLSRGAKRARALQRMIDLQLSASDRVQLQRILGIR